MKTVLITGITGQDGSYLANLLSKDGNYKIYGLVRSLSNDHIKFLKDVGLEHVQLIQGDIVDQSYINKILSTYKFDYVYNFAAQSNVSMSYEQPIYTLEATGFSVLYFLEAIKNYSPRTRFFQASSSEVFDSGNYTICSETTPRDPKSPYGIAKSVADQYVKYYRNTYNIFACSGIFFNHESYRRGNQFFTKKVIQYIARYGSGLHSDPLKVGNINVFKDWGYAPEYIEAAKLVLENTYPDDFVIGTGNLHSTQDFITLAFQHYGIKLQWNKENTEAYDGSGLVYVETDPLLLRPNYQNCIKADISKIRKVLNWEPKVNFSELINIMLTKEITQDDSSPYQTNNQQTHSAT